MAKDDRKEGELKDNQLEKRQYVNGRLRHSQCKLNVNMSICISAHYGLSLPARRRAAQVANGKCFPFDYMND